MSPFDPQITGMDSGLEINPLQTALLKAHLIVETRTKHFQERREKLKGAKFHQPKGEYVLSSFDAIDYGDEGFDAAAPFGGGIFDKFLFQRKKTENEDSGELIVR